MSPTFCSQSQLGSHSLWYYLFCTCLHRKHILVIVRESVLFRLQTLEIKSFWLICTLMFQCDLSAVFVVQQVKSDFQLMPVQLPHCLWGLDRLLRLSGPHTHTHTLSKLTITVVPRHRTMSLLRAIDSGTVAHIWQPLQKPSRRQPYYYYKTCSLFISVPLFSVCSVLCSLL